VGEQTTGSTGQPVGIPLPGGGAAYILTKLDTWPNGAPIVGVGLSPDIKLAPTIADVRQGRDAVLEQVQALLLQGRLQGEPHAELANKQVIKPTCVMMPSAIP
jgi:C-terminal processing protease CtpA/Prc